MISMSACSKEPFGCEYLLEHLSALLSLVWWRALSFSLSRSPFSECLLWSFLDAGSEFVILIGWLTPLLSAETKTFEVQGCGWSNNNNIFKKLRTLYFHLCLYLGSADAVVAGVAAAAALEEELALTAAYKIHFLLLHLFVSSTYRK